MSSNRRFEADALDAPNPDGRPYARAAQAER